MKMCIALEINSMPFRNKIIIRLKTSSVLFKVSYLDNDCSKLNHLYFLEYLLISESVYPMNIMTKQFEWMIIKNRE